MEDEEKTGLCCGPRVKDTILGILDSQINDKKSRAEPFGELLESRSFVETLEACDIESTIKKSVAPPEPVIKDEPITERIDSIVRETTPTLDIKEELDEAMRPRPPIRPSHPDERIILKREHIPIEEKES